MALITPACARYTHGEPLFAIAEEAEPMVVTENIQQLPTEILSRIFSLATKSPLERRAQVIQLLAITHVSSVFRRTALDDPSLWSQTLFVNNIHPELLEAILERSSHLPLSLSFVEDETLCVDSRAWSLLLDCLPRLQSLSIEVFEGFTGARAKLLLTFLTVEAPVLEDCSVWFHGDRSVPLKCFILDDSLQPGGSRTPQLRTLELINCFIPLDRCRLPSLTSITLRSIHAKPVLPTPEHFFRFRSQFQYLQRLTLYNPFDEACDNFDTLLCLPPIRLFAIRIRE